MKDNIPQDCLRCDAGPLTLSCMDIWGGVDAADQQFSTPGLDVHVLSEPYKGDAEGGDVYYLSLCGSGNIARMALADVSGHGSAVGEIATRLRSMMRKHINTPNQARFAQSLNEQFGRISDSGVFATAVLATYWAPTDHLILVNAGHPPPLLYRADQGAWMALTAATPGVVTSDASAVGVRNLPLGIIEPTGYDQFAVHLDPHDLVVLHTDALMEARDRRGGQLGVEGLLRVAAEADGSRSENFGRRLIEGARAHADDEPIGDDNTLIVLHHNAANPPPMTVKESVRTLGRMMGLVGPSAASRA